MGHVGAQGPQRFRARELMAGENGLTRTTVQGSTLWPGVLLGTALAAIWKALSLGVVWTLGEERVDSHSFVLLTGEVPLVLAWICYAYCRPRSRLAAVPGARVLAALCTWSLTVYATTWWLRAGTPIPLVLAIAIPIAAVVTALWLLFGGVSVPGWGAFAFFLGTVAVTEWAWRSPVYWWMTGSAEVLGYQLIFLDWLVRFSFCIFLGVWIYSSRSGQRLLEQRAFAQRPRWARIAALTPLIVWALLPI